MTLRESVKHALPEPSLGGGQPGEFGATIWRDWLTEEVVDRLGLNERQRQAVDVVKTEGRITNTVYQEVTQTSRPTAIRDLADLVANGVFLRHGVARSASYGMAGMRLRNDSNDSQRNGQTHDSEMTQMNHTPRRKTRHKPVKPASKGAGRRPKGHLSAPASPKTTP